MQCKRFGKEGKRRPLLQPAERVGVPWERVGIDFTEITKVKDGNSKIWVMVDRATKFVIAKTTQNG